MMIDREEVRRQAGDVVATARRGMTVRGEDMVVAVLVALPFAGAFGIWLAWLTWWPNPVIWAFTALAAVAGAAYAAGAMGAGAEDHE